MIRRLSPLLLVLLPVTAALVAYLAAGPDFWRPETVLAKRDALKAASAAAPLLSLLIFTALYFTIISTALPVGPPMSLIAGFLFGRWIGSLAILCGATAGALVVYAIARRSAGSALGGRLRAKAGALVSTVGQDFRANAFGYVLVMRLIPLFPFFLVNVVSGLFAIPWRAFALATLLGRIPAAFIYVSLGEEIGRVSSLADLLSPRIGLTLGGIGLLALGPVILAHRRRARRGLR